MIDLVADLADALERLAVRVVELPVDVALPGDEGAGIAAAHRHHHVRPLGVGAVELARDAVGDVDAELAHHVDDLRVHALRGVRPRGARDVRADCGEVEEGACDLGAAGVLDADEEDVHAATSGRRWSSSAPGSTESEAKRPRCSRTVTPRPPASAAAGPRRRLDYRQPFRLGLARLHGLDDRAVHAVCHLVRELDAHVLEPGRLEPGDVLAPRERAGDAADVGATLAALLRGEVVLRNDVGDPDAAA